MTCESFCREHNLTGRRAQLAESGFAWLASNQYGSRAEARAGLERHYKREYGFGYWMLWPIIQWLIGLILKRWFGDDR